MTVLATPSYDLMLQIKGWMEVILTMNDFRTNLGASVTTEPQSHQAADGKIVIVATDLPIEKDTARTRFGAVEVVIEAEIPATRENAEQMAHFALADILQAIPAKQANPDMPAGCAGLIVTGRRILRRPDGSPLIVAQVTARAGLTEHTTRV